MALPPTISVGDTVTFSFDNVTASDLTGEVLAYVATSNMYVIQTGTKIHYVKNYWYITKELE